MKGPLHMSGQEDMQQGLSNGCCAYRGLAGKASQLPLFCWCSAAQVLCGAILGVLVGLLYPSPAPIPL